jgi:pilus assembly protein CpaB
MKPARIFVLVIAIVAGLAAAMLASASKPPEVAAVQPPPPIPTEGILVAANDLYRGDILAESSLRWVDWPAEKIPEGVIRKSASPGAIEELKGGRLRANFAANEPIRRERVAAGPHSASWDARYCH